MLDKFPFGARSKANTEPHVTHLRCAKGRSLSMVLRLLLLSISAHVREQKTFGALPFRGPVNSFPHKGQVEVISPPFQFPLLLPACAAFCHTILHSFEQFIRRSAFDGMTSNDLPHVTHVLTIRSLPLLGSLSVKAKEKACCDGVLGGKLSMINLLNRLVHASGCFQHRRCNNIFTSTVYHKPACRATSGGIFMIKHQFPASYCRCSVYYQRVKPEDKVITLPRNYKIMEIVTI